MFRVVHFIKESDMNWLLLLLVTMFAPIVQPAINRGAHHMQAQFRQNQPQTLSAPRFVYHEGRWWKFEQGQWYVEVK